MGHRSVDIRQAHENKENKGCEISVDFMNDASLAARQFWGKVRSNNRSLKAA
jgi:hypothetical protein